MKNEDFLAVYDPNLRKDAGAYYTPVEVVRAQVRLVDDLLVHRLNKPLGFADKDVTTLDPAAGTGTYLLGVIEHALQRVQRVQGDGALAAQATRLAAGLHGFERMVGPYAVSEMRIARALRDRGANLPREGARVYLTDTLESPHAEPPQGPLFMKPMADQHAKALQVKSGAPVLVCLGNPPYDRHEAATATNGHRTGAWVRWGDGGDGKDAILQDFLAPVTKAGQGGRAKNLYNLYVYFWRWALWKVFEQKGAQGPGVVSLITASSYLDGAAFLGMREHMRRLCDEIWILDLGGEGRGARQGDNVFAIQTPVAIAVVFRSGPGNRNKAASVRYTRIEGSRSAKLAALGAIEGFAQLDWRDCPNGWQAPFRPAGEGEYFHWPLLTDLMPWQHSGVQLKRTWPIAPDADTLERRWRALLAAEDRAAAFRETGDRRVQGTYNVRLVANQDPTPIAELPRNARTPETVGYAYHTFDRQHLIADGRLMSRPRPDLWAAHGKRQLYLTSLLTKPLGVGPALTASALIPDLHHFSGRGAKDVVPLYRAADASEPNIVTGLLDLLGKGYGRAVTPEDFAAYLYGALAQPAFTKRFAKELESAQLRVPITRDAELFEQVRAIGANLLMLHTYGRRYRPPGLSVDQPAQGAARCLEGVPLDGDGYPECFAHDVATATLHVGAGKFAPVTLDVYAFEVSGLKVVQSWLKYRMRNGAGRKSSPLDRIRPRCWPAEFTTELLELLWLLEATLALHPEQERLLKAVVECDCFEVGELPEAPELMRKPPQARGALHLPRQ